MHSCMYVCMYVCMGQERGGGLLINVGDCGGKNKKKQLCSYNETSPKSVLSMQLKYASQQASKQASACLYVNIMRMLWLC